MGLALEMAERERMQGLGCSGAKAPLAIVQKEFQVHKPTTGQNMWRSLLRSYSPHQTFR